MSWTPASAPERKSGTATASSKATVALSAPKGRTHHIRIALRTAIIDVDWLAIGGHISVEIGSGDHSGMLRLSKSGTVPVLGTVGAKSKNKTMTVALVPFPGIAIAHRPAQVCGVTVQGDAIIISLPSWACAPEPVAAPVKQPFGISGPDHAEMHTRRLGSRS